MARWTAWKLYFWTDLKSVLGLDEGEANNERDSVLAEELLDTLPAPDESLGRDQ